MAYIKFRLTRTTDASGNAMHGKVSRIESDMPSLDTLQPNMIWHALSFASAVKQWLMMDTGVLDRDMLADSDVMQFDMGMLDVDKLF